jgi:carbonic anhydrase
MQLTLPPDESLAVIGFFIEVASGSDPVSPLLTAALANIGSIPSAGDKTTTGALDFSSLVSHLNSATVAQYAGSLTTPPCYEGVTFNVVQSPLYISVGTFRALKDVVKFNARYTQNTPGQVNLLDNARNVLDS